MLRRLLPLVLVLFSGKLWAYEFPIEVIEYIDNTKIVVFINEEDIDKSLLWRPFETALPLAINDVLELMHKQITTDPALAEASLTGIELKPIPHHDGYWHYLVKMKSQVNGASRSSYFVILMNGKVIAGMREPETLK